MSQKIEKHVCVLSNKEKNEIYFCVNSQNATARFYKSINNVFSASNIKGWTTHKKYRGFSKLHKFSTWYKNLKKKLIRFLGRTQPVVEILPCAVKNGKIRFHRKHLAVKMIY